MNTNSFSIGAFAIIFDKEGRILLSHRLDLDIWNLPGGKVENGELPNEAVIRETKEETGLDIEVEKLVGIYGKKYKNEIVFSFKCKVIGGVLRITKEADKHEYFEIENIPVNTIPKQVERIKDANNSYSQPIFRIQDSPSTKEYLKTINSE